MGDVHAQHGLPGQVGRRADDVFRPCAAGEREVKAKTSKPTLIVVPLGTSVQPSVSEKSSLWELFSFTGGEGGIRTHGTLARTPDFESGTFDHSATSPKSVLRSLQEARIIASGFSLCKGIILTA
jgi:hypothetical protein